MPRSVRVSPRHHVALSEDYLTMIDRAPREDFVVRTLAHKKAGETTLMMGELVIAGAATREQYALARRYPLHFRKTYYPGGMHGDPRAEFDLHMRASSVVPVPPPIGATRETFRSCLLPGSPLNRLSSLVLNRTRATSRRPRAFAGFRRGTVAADGRSAQVVDAVASLGSDSR